MSGRGRVWPYEWGREVAPCTSPAACRRLKAVIQAEVDRYLDVYAKELGEYIEIGYMRGWYGHLREG